MLLGRLKDDRALSTILPPPGTTLALMPSMNRTSGVQLKLMPNDHEELPTSPENLKPTETPPPGTHPLEEIAFHEEGVETWAGYDESKFMHRATAALIERTNLLLRFQQSHDVEAIVQRQRVLFEETVTTKLDVVVVRVDGDMRDLRAELKLMKARMAQIEIALGIKVAP